MGARRNFRGGGASPEKAPHRDKKGPPYGEKVAKKSSYGENVPHKEKSVAKGSQHREQVAKRPPNNEILYSRGDQAPILAPPPHSYMRAPISILLKYSYIFS